MLLRDNRKKREIDQAAWRLPSCSAGNGWQIAQTASRFVVDPQQLQSSRSSNAAADIFDSSGTSTAVTTSSALNSSAVAKSR